MFSKALEEERWKQIFQRILVPETVTNTLLQKTGARRPENINYSEQCGR